MKHPIYILLAVALVVTACSSKKKNPAFYGSSETESDSIYEGGIDGYDSCYEYEGETISVPFTEQDGIKLIPVSVNGMSLKMVFDTGSTFTQISIAEAKYLYDKGCLTEDDFVDYAKGQLADGSIVENMVVRLKEVIIDEKITFNDVLATVSDNNEAPLMLGNEILDRTASVEVDNESQVINFKLK